MLSTITPGTTECASHVLSNLIQQPCELVLTLHSLGLREINGVAYSASREQRQPGPLKEQTLTDAVSRHLVVVLVTTVIYLIPTAKCLEVWRIFSGNQNFGRALQNVAGPVQTHRVFFFIF